MFKTLEEANEWKVQKEKELNDLLTAHEGLKNKLSEVEATVSSKDDEIKKLKIKNYEYLEQISISNSGQANEQTNTEDNSEINFEEFLNKF